MLRNVNPLIGYTLQAEDGPLGKVDDLLFTDADWILRYLVVDTGDWLVERKIIIPCGMLGQPRWEAKVFPVALTKQQVQDSPPLDADAPVSRQHENRLLNYLSIHPYWTGEAMGGGFPAGRREDQGPLGEIQPEREPSESECPGGNLRSCDEVSGYRMGARDGDIGHLDDFLIDDYSWTIRYLIVATRNWLPGRKVLIAPSWVSEIEWDSGRVRVDLTRESIQESPEYDPDEVVTRDYEERLFAHHRRPPYWND
ncbi:MAG: PRC-barrel domain containing protein [Candidatus Eisenbacteria bacterium]|nr:PRC-barrel domain containing protein [Candidatus Eisenbacteria bacterium]